MQEEENYEYSLVQCDLCGHKWVAVRPVDTPKLECPNCGNIGYFEDIPLPNKPKQQNT
jgi:DNA-directed RNA polymerase subunit RPC12/RpoP